MRLSYNRGIYPLKKHEIELGLYHAVLESQEWGTVKYLFQYKSLIRRLDTRVPRGDLGVGHAADGRDFFA